MADPTYEIQGISNIHPLDVITGFTATGGTATIDHGGLALNADASSPATAEFRFPLPNGPVNGSDVLFIVRLYNSTNQFVQNGIIRFFDSAGDKTEVVPLDEWRRGELLYRIHIPSLSGFVSDPGFDIADLTHIEFVVEIGDTDESDVYVLRRLDYYDFSPVVLTGGVSGNPFTLDTILATLNNDFWGYDYSAEEGWLKEYPRQSGPLLEPDVPIQVGDGVPGSTFFEFGSLQGWSLLNALQDRSPWKGSTGNNDYAEIFGVLPAAGRTLRLNLGDSQAFPPAIVFQAKFADLSPVPITFRSWLFLKTQPEFSELSVLESCSLIDSESPVRGGDLCSDCAFVNSTADIAIEWNGTADFVNCRIDCPASDYGVNFDGANFNDGDTFDASSITFVSAPLVRKFRLDAPGQTLNLDVGSTGVTAADVEVVAGSLNIIAAQLTLTLTDVPVGAEVRIYDLDSGTPGDFGTELAGTETLSGSTFEYVHSKAGDQVFVQVFAAGFQEFGEVTNLLSVSQSIQVGLEPEDSF